MGLHIKKVKNKDRKGIVINPFLIMVLNDVSRKKELLKTSELI